MDEATIKRIRENIATAEGQLKTLREDISRARQAGIDIADLEKRYSDLTQRVATLKAVYGR